jgi:hypothetical protein
MSLSSGEIRVVYLPPRAVIVGVKGHAAVVERVDGLGEASFSLCTPVRQGETYAVAYGGQVLLRAAQCTQLRIVLPQSQGQLWRKRLGRVCKAVQRSIHALSRRVQGA